MQSVHLSDPEVAVLAALLSVDTPAGWGSEQWNSALASADDVLRAGRDRLEARGFLAMESGTVTLSPTTGAIAVLLFYPASLLIFDDEQSDGMERRVVVHMRDSFRISTVREHGGFLVRGEASLASAIERALGALPGKVSGATFELTAQEFLALRDQTGDHARTSIARAMRRSGLAPADANVDATAVAAPQRQITISVVIVDDRVATDARNILVMADAEHTWSCEPHGPAILRIVESGGIRLARRIAEVVTELAPRRDASLKAPT